MVKMPPHLEMFLQRRFFCFFPFTWNCIGIIAKYADLKSLLLFLSLFIFLLDLFYLILYCQNHI
jgi:hypothetical protein